MAAPIVNEDLIGVRFQCTYQGQVIMLTHCYRVHGASGGPIDLIDGYNALRAALSAAGSVESALADCYSDSVADITTTVQKIYPDRWIQQTQPSAFPEGTNTSTFHDMPANVAGTINMQAQIAGKHSRGTKHIGCMADGFQVGGVLTPTAKTLYSSLGSELALPRACTGTGFSFSAYPVIFNRTAPVNSLEVYSHTVGTTSRVERRRTVGLGI